MSIKIIKEAIQKYMSIDVTSKKNLEKDQVFFYGYHISSEK